MVKELTPLKNGLQWKVKVQIMYSFTKSYFCRTILHHYQATHYLSYLDVVTSTPQYPEFSGAAKNLSGHMCGSAEIVHH